jgi:hypothetical protein
MTMFTYKHTQFEGINNLYADNILPQLLPLETQRKAVWPKFYRFAAGVFIAAAIGMGFIFKQNLHPLFFAFAGGLAIIILRVYYTSISNPVRGETKQILMGEICRFIGLSYTEQDALHPPVIDEWQALSLLPHRLDRIAFEDFISGEINGTDMQLCEAKLERKVKTDKGHRWDTVFRGSLITLDFHRDFLGTTLVLRDAGVFNAKKKNGMKRIGLGEPQFEKIFEAYGTDQVEGRYLLTPVFMEKLVALEESVEGDKIRFAFHGGRLWVAVEHLNRFETRSLRQSLTDSSRVQNVIDEIDAILSIITAVSITKRRR